MSRRCKVCFRPFLGVDLIVGFFFSSTSEGGADLIGHGGMVRDIAVSADGSEHQRLTTPSDVNTLAFGLNGDVLFTGHKDGDLTPPGAPAPMREIGAGLCPAV